MSGNFQRIHIRFIKHEIECVLNFETDECIIQIFTWLLRNDINRDNGTRDF